MESLLGATVHGIRLVDRLGQGGMGEVYLGFDERLERKVAVKAIRSEKRLDPVAKARFLREARVLSQLEHPNICRLYDYVEDAEADFLILEYVQGRNLRELTGSHVSFEAKLAVAGQVAGALVAAHALSIVHRDLKPENVVVTPEGQAKVLDFGLARPVRAADLTGEFQRDGTPRAAGPDPSSGSGGTVTELGIVVGTPRYMSPEQARGEGVTAASDVYSFGLLLQELFTGSSPLPRDAEPAVLLQKAMWGETEPVRGIDGHLAELITQLKALAPKDRPSAQAAAARLAWIAEKPHRRLRRLMWSAAALVLAVAAVVSTAGFVQARRALARAEASESVARQAQADAEAVNSFLRNMLTSADPRARGINVKVVDVLDRAAAGVDSDFAGRFTSQAAILDTLGGTYHALGELQKAHDLLVRAVDLRRRTLGDTAPETLASEHRLGTVLVERASFAEAIKLLRRTLAAREATLGAEHRDTLDTVMVLAQALQRDRQFEEAETLYRRGYEARRRNLGPDDPDTLEAALQLGSIERDFERWDEAERLIRQSLDGARRTLGPKHPQTIAALVGLAVLYGRQARNAESVALFREVLALQVEVLGPEHPRTLNTRRNLGGNLIYLKQFAEAKELLAATETVQTRTLGPAHHETLETMRNLAQLAEAQGDLKTCERIQRERWERARQHLGEEDRITLETKSVVANVLVAHGCLAEGERLHREVLASRRRVFGEDGEATLRSKKNLAKLLASTGRLEEARALDPTVKATPAGGGRPR